MLYLYRITKFFLSFLATLTIGLLFLKSLSSSSPEITAAIIGLLGVLIGAIWSHHKTKEREINARHFLEKKSAYMILIDLIFDLFTAQKAGQEITEEDMQKTIMRFKKELMVWGHQDVIKTLDQYERKSLKKSKEKDILLNADDLLRSIRQDLGHDDQSLARGALVSMLLVAEERDKLFK